MCRFSSATQRTWEAAFPGRSPQLGCGLGQPAPDGLGRLQGDKEAAGCHGPPLHRPRWWRESGSEEEEPSSGFAGSAPVLPKTL